MLYVCIILETHLLQLNTNHKTEYKLSLYLWHLPLVLQDIVICIPSSNHYKGVWHYNILEYMGCVKL